ncbi:MAG: hypothetical protein PF569_10305 [Candidatus Woesearchaeota archaeon]|jgi:hypothetical protein|nr:hypothetical protein [Candidatus Woesearchaeota archaeon]
MKLSKDYFIEGKLIKEGTEVKIIQEENKEHSIKENQEFFSIRKAPNYIDTGEFYIIDRNYTYIKRHLSIEEAHQIYSGIDSILRLKDEVERKFDIELDLTAKNNKR